MSATGDLDKLAEVLRREILASSNVVVLDDSVRVWVNQLHGVLPAIVTAADDAGFTVSDMSASEPTLETVFIDLTGKELRE